MSGASTPPRTSPLIAAPTAVAPYFAARQIESSAVGRLREEIAALTRERDTMLARTEAEIAERRRVAEAALEELRAACRREELERCRAEMAEVLRGIVAAHQSLLREIEEETPSLVLDLARKVVGAELTGPGGGRAWRALLAEALRESRAGGDLSLRVPPVHVGAVRDAVSELSRGELAGRSIEVVADDGLAEGTCIIKPASGSIEVSIQRAFDHAAGLLADSPAALCRASQPCVTGGRR